MRIFRAVLAFACVSAVDCAAWARPAAPTAATHASPPVRSAEPAHPSAAGRRVVAEHGAVASASSFASEAGVEILKAGGNAVDAAVATALALGVVEPEMSGLGAGGGMTIWISKDSQPYYLDFYSAQNAARMAAAGAIGPLRSPTDLRVVGIPGDVAGLLAAHERFGALPLERVIAPAVRLADDGFPIGQILADFVRADSAKLHRFPAAAAQWWPDGRALQPGDVYRNPTLATTLRRIASLGAAGFYEGPVAEALVRLLNANGHPATAADLAAYEPLWKRPLCTDYRGLAVLSAPPPQTGMQVLETLELLEPHHLAELGLPTTSPRAFDVLTSALRVGQADADWNDDPRWAPVPARGVASAQFAASREALVGAGAGADSLGRGDARAFDHAPTPEACRGLDPYPAANADGARQSDAAQVHEVARDPDGAARTRVARPAPPATGDPLSDGAETTHLSVVDAAGNAVALTQTNSSVFGSGAWLEGFFLNDSGYLWRDSVGSMPQGTSWRTRNSTISPTIVLDGRQVRMVIGAPGGGRIPTEIAQVMAYILDYGMDPLEAVRMPRIYPNEDDADVQLEHGFEPELLGAIRRMGWNPVPESFGYARLYLIVRRDGHWIAVSDPRHDGEPRGY